MERSLVVLAELTHSPLLLSPAWLWIHEINWRHGNMLQDWTMATNLVKEPLLKGGLTNQQPSLTHFCCFAFWDELEEEKQELCNISLSWKISHLLWFICFFCVCVFLTELCLTLKFWILGVSEGSLVDNQTLVWPPSMCSYHFPFNLQLFCAAHPERRIHTGSHMQRSCWQQLCFTL